MKKVLNKIVELYNKSKIDFKNFYKDNTIFLFFVISSVINSTLLRFYTVKNYFEFRAILADIATIMLIGAIAYLLKEKRRNGYFIIWSIFLTSACIVNSLYYNNYVSFPSVSMIATAFQLSTIGGAVVKVMEVKDYSFLWQPIVIIALHLNAKKRLREQFGKTKEFEYKQSKYSFWTAVKITATASIIFIIFTMSLKPLDFSRLNKLWIREYIVMRFGIYFYHANDIVASIKPKITPFFGFDNAAREFREFFDDIPDEQTKNQYSNIFEGYNVITIHAEGIQTFLLDNELEGQEIMPNLTRLSKEGLYFSNFYAQDGVGTSSDTEFTFSTGLLPSSSGAVFVSYWDRTYSTLQKLLQEKDYYTFSMHGNNASFWNRNVVHPRLGFDNFYAFTDAFEIDEIIGLGLSDKSFFRQSVPIIEKNMKENKKFYANLIMLTNHTPFTDIVEHSDFKVTMTYEGINPETGELEIMEAPYLEGTTMGNYIKSANYADAAIGEFLEALDTVGALDNTVVVIYGDHDAKLKRPEYNRYYNYDPHTGKIKDSSDPDFVTVDYYSYELNRKVPYIIWSKDKKLKKEVDMVMGMYDASPTLANMLGVYNKYALGKDIFNVEENVVIFPDGNWLTNKMYYNSQKNEGFLIDPNLPVSVEYIDRYINYSEKVMTISNNIIIYDLIKKIEDQDKLIEAEANKGFLE